MLRFISLLCAAIAVAMIGMTALAPTALTQQRLQGAGPCPLGEVPIPGADKNPPALDTNWAPVSGTTVRPGDQIKVTMVARDPDPRPSGIKTIQLVADSEDGRFIASENYEACSEPRERRVEATYTVPVNPPPIVRLTALTEDHAGLMDTDVGEFPTSVEGAHEETSDSEDPTGEGSDWTGQIDWWLPFPAGRMWGRLDLTFDDDGQGNLKGQMTGDDHVETQPRGEFCGMTTQTPSKLSAKLTGQYTPGRNTMSLRIADPQIEQGQYSLCAIGPDGAPFPMSGMPFGGGGPLGQPGLAELLNSLTVSSDGSVEASGEWPVTPASAVPTTLHLKLTLHRTQN
jgi:hypothetical protein